MKKSVLLALLVPVVCSTAFGNDDDKSEAYKAPSAVHEHINASTNPPEIVKDLKDREREIYDSLKKGNGKRGVIKSTVTVSEDGTETVENENVDSK